MCIVMTKHFQPNRFHEHFFLTFVLHLPPRCKVAYGFCNRELTWWMKREYKIRTKQKIQTELYCVMYNTMTQTHTFVFVYTHSEHKNSARRYIENTQAPNGVNGIEKKCYVDLLLMCSDEFWMDRQTTKPKPIRELDSVVRFIVKMKIYWFIPFVLQAVEYVRVCMMCCGKALIVRYATTNCSLVACSFIDLHSIAYWELHIKIQRFVRWPRYKVPHSSYITSHLMFVFLLVH